jgi:hypothetical protein
MKWSPHNMKPNTKTIRKVARSATIQWSSLNTHNWCSVLCDVKISTMRIGVVGLSVKMWSRMWNYFSYCNTNKCFAVWLTSADVILTAETRSMLLTERESKLVYSFDDLPFVKRLRRRLWIVKKLLKYISQSAPGSVVGIATAYRLDGPKIESRWCEIFRTCSDRPSDPRSLLYNGYRVFPGGKVRPGRDADPSPLLVPRSKIE